MNARLGDPLPARASDRYATLDLCRGIAALMVLLHHLGAVSCGYEAVLVFFVISGYCIAASIAAGAQRGDGFLTFVRRRVHRIFPPYLFSIAFFAATRLARQLTGGDPFSAPLWQWAANATLTQWLPLIAHPVAMPMANPANFVAAYWSLCYEEQFYLVMAAAAALTARSRGALLLALTALGVAWNLGLPGTCRGVFIEYWAAFAAGILLFHRTRRMPSGAARRLVDAALALIVIVAAAVAWGSATPGGQRPIAREYAVVGGFTLLMLWLRPLDQRIAGSRIGAVLGGLGTISYSLYLIHQFNLVVIAKLAHVLLPRALEAALVVPTEVALHLGLATGFWYLCERPFLNRPRTAAVAGTPTASG
jgi:peptidoglycan/LPS O-acetylase OafA/YrhL